MSDYAVNTITLHDALEIDATLLDFISLSTEAQTTKFKNMFIARWDIYELAGETIPLSKRFLKNKFDTNKDYYQELIDDYENKITYLNGIISTEELTYSDSGNGSVNKSGTKSLTDDTTKSGTNTINDTINKSENNGINKDLIDLPNKTVSTNYVSKKDNTSETKQGVQQDSFSQATQDIVSNTKDETSQDAQTYLDAKSGTKTVSRTGDVNILEQKIKYQKYLRNIYLEFAERFKECFCLLYN